LAEPINHEAARLSARFGPGVEEDAQDRAAVRWIASHYRNSMRIAAAVVLAQQGTLDRAADLLELGGFQDVPVGYFTTEEEYDFQEPEERIGVWLEREQDTFERLMATEAFTLAVNGYSY
jgi:hypothetical protein